MLCAFGALKRKGAVEKMPAGRDKAEELHFPGHATPLPELRPFLSAVMGCAVSLLCQLARPARPFKKM